MYSRHEHHQNEIFRREKERRRAERKRVIPSTQVGKNQTVFLSVFFLSLFPFLFCRMGIVARNAQFRLGSTAPFSYANQPGYAQTRLLLIRARHFIGACAVRRARLWALNALTPVATGRQTPVTMATLPIFQSESAYFSLSILNTYNAIVGRIDCINRVMRTTCQKLI